MLSVIATHAGAGSLPYGLGRIGANGARGVQLFFLISSYLAFVSFKKNTEEKGLHLKSAGEWLFYKYIKIMPLYIMSIFVYLLIQGNGGRYWLGSIEKVSLCNIISHVFFLNAFQPYYINSIQGVEWYLADLFIFYLLTPVLFKWINTLKKAAILLVVSNICSVLLTYFLSGFCPIRDAYIWETYISNFAFFCQFPVWIMGIVIYHLDYEEMKKDNKASVILLTAALLIMLLMLKGMDLHLLSSCFLWAIAFGFIMIGEKKARISFARNVFIEYIGMISYPMYLFHYLIIYLWEKYTSVSELTIINFGVKYICVVAASIVVSAVIMWISKTWKQRGKWSAF